MLGNHSQFSYAFIKKNKTFQADKQKNIDLGLGTFLIFLNLITLHFNPKRKFLNNLLNSVTEEMLRKTRNKVS